MAAHMNVLVVIRAHVLTAVVFSAVSSVKGVMPSWKHH
jgi:hypothetical protein